MFKKKLLLASGLIFSMAASSSLWAAQFAYPDGPIGSQTDYTPTGAATNWEAVGEGATVNDGSYITTTINPGVIEFSLSNTIIDPGVDTGHVLRFRAQNPTRNHKNVTISLYEGTNLRGENTIQVSKNTNAWTDYSYTIPTASVTVYNNLSIRISGTGTTQSPVEISWVALETGDSSGVPPTVDSPTFASVTDTSAILGGRVTDLGTPASLSGGCGVEWGLAPGSWPNRVSGAVPCSAVNDVFTVSVTGLPSSDDIYFRAWANNGQDGFSAEGGPFTTLAPASPPTVTTDAVTVFGQNSATMGGEVTADGGAAVSARGVYWNTASPAENGTQVQIGSGLGTFSQSVGGLPAGTPIFVKAYATNSAGEALGGQVSFTTLAGLATVATRAVENITATSADLGGNVTNNGGAAVTERGVVWNTTNPPETGGTVVPNGSGTGSFIATVGGLPTGTVVYFKAYAVNAEGTAYSDVQNFTPAGSPIVTATTPVTNILLNSATLGGDISNDGGSPITARGIVWNTTSPAESGGTIVPMGSGIGTFSQTVSGLPAATTIFWKAYGINAVATGYSAGESFDTLSEPTVQASNLLFPTLAGRSMRITWARGNGDGVIVVMRLQATGGTPPADGDDYTANTDYTLAPELPVNSQNYVVYKGPGTSVTVTGLTMTTDYTVAVYEYAGTGAATDYLLTPLVEASAQTTDYAVHNYDWGVDCDDCHNHGSFNASGDQLKAICETCHTGLGPASAKLEFDNHLTPNKNPAIDNVDCGMCHELHNLSATNTTESLNSITLQTQHNKSFLRANVDKYVPTAATPAYLHTDDPTGAPDSAVTPERAVEGGNDTTARGYCQVCHTLTNYHRSSNTAEADQCHDGQSGNCGPAETQCGNCHQHNNKFIGVGGSQTCIECHSSFQGSRDIITTQFDRASTHIPGGSAVTTEPDCLVCHNQGGHTGGAVSVWDADNMSTSFTQPTPGASTTDPVEGEAFEPHCMSCHEDGLASGLPASGSDQTQASPFIGSGAAPIIDETAWNSAGHNRSTAPVVSCVGACHGSGHGSEQNSLLAPAAGPAVSGVDFCYSCHDSDGPSTIDIQSQFAAWTRPPVTLGSGASVDEKHSLACAGCHSPHIDNTANPVSNIDTGAPLSAYSDNLGSYGVGADPTFGVPQPDYIEFCLVCHDNNPPPGVTIPGGMVDMSAAWFSNDQHGTNDGNGSGNGFLKPPFNSGTGEPGNFAALNCTTCHGAHGSGNIFNLRTSINVGGTQMTVGGWLGDTIGEDPLTPGVARQNQTVYTLPETGGVQVDHDWGAWCSFCHQHESHGRDEDVACTSGHMHGAKQF